MLIQIIKGDKEHMFKKKIIVALALITSCTSLASYAFDEKVEAYMNSVNLQVNGMAVGLIGENYPLSNGSETPLSLLVNGTTYLPVSKISEVLGVEVKWDADTRTVVLGTASTENITETENALKTNLPESIELVYVNGNTFVMGSNEMMGSPTQRIAAPEHEVTLSSYYMSEAEITNDQYVEFLNEAYQDGLISIKTETAGPNAGHRLIQGTKTSSYEGKILLDIDGTRVLKDHDDADGDNDPFTGDVEPENPLNTSYIGFDDLSDAFYVKDPYNVEDFNWYEMCNYSDYSTTSRKTKEAVLNDFEDWSGSGQKLSDELNGWTETNPELAQNLPTLSDVKLWPVTFVRWWGAEAFATYYDASLPTEAQWEYAAKTDQNYIYSVYDGIDITDANWNQKGGVALGHVREAVSGQVNPFGFYNLGGNAWEWIADNYVDTYDVYNNSDPIVVIPDSTTRCWRGGSWNYHEATLQTAIRFYDEETRGNDHFGFRIVVNP